jgi:hypothetical protein
MLCFHCMTYAKRSLYLATGGLFIVAGAACSAMTSSEGAGDRSDSPKASGTSSSGGSSGDGNTEPGAAASGPTATGVVLVHAAAFPSFRLCFKNLPNELPQPDSTVMPEANVVGVEIGSLVRIDPLVAPGTVYVINERETRLSPTAKCGELLGPEIQKPKTQATLTKNIHYHVANTLETPLGSNQVNVLAITGCGRQEFLDDLKIDSASCPTPWSATGGNLEAKIVNLSTTPEGATDSKLPIQMFHMSPAIDAFKGPSGTFEVSFGPLSTPTPAKLQQPVSTSVAFEGGAQSTLNLAQTNDSVYGSYGFRVTVKNGSATESVDQSLAIVQELSSSRDLPTTYYRVASNYALLLLGDPAHKATLTNGSPNPDFNPRQGVHILAIPVLDPTKVDAGAPDSGGTTGPGPDGG